MNSSKKNSQILYVTGCNASYFFIACTLLGSLRVFSPQAKMKVCDFGLTEGQRTFFEENDILLSKPSMLPEGRHVYYYKGCLGHYVEQEDFDTMVWIDADCIVTGPLSEFMDTLVGQQDFDTEFFAYPPDVENRSNRELIMQEAKKVAPFTQLMQTIPDALDKPYISAAVFAIRSRKTLEEWAKIVQQIPMHFLFEQNCLSYVVHKNISNVIPLKQDQWDVRGDSLSQLKIVETEKNLFVYNGEQRVYNLHLSDEKQQKFVQLIALNLPLEDKNLLGLFREAREPTFKELSYNLLSAYLYKEPGNQKLLYGCAVDMTQIPLEPNIPISEQPSLAHYYKTG